MAEARVRGTAVGQSEENPWLEAGAVLGTGLYLARMASEALPGVRTGSQIAFLVLTCIVVSWFLSRLLVRIRLRRAELGLLLIYVLWPALNMTVGWSVGILTVGIWIWRIRPLSNPRLSFASSWLPEALAGAFGLWLYSATVAPTVLPADAGEFQVVGSTLGIAHPPGYALYTLLARLATLVPVGDKAFRVNLLSVLFASITLVLLVRLVRRVSPVEGASRGVSWSAALAVAALVSSPTYWVQATTANIRSLTGLFTAALLVLALRYVQRPSRGRLAVLLFVFGLAAGHHSSLVLLGLPLALYVLLSDSGLLRRSSYWLAGIGALLASLLVLAYLPLRSRMGPAFDPVPVDSVARFLDHVLALGFRGDVFYLKSWSDLLERLLVYFQILRLQFGVWLPWAMLFSLLGVFWHNWRLGVMLGGIWVVNALSAITYRAPQTVEYLIPSYVAMAASLGCGLRLVVERMPQRRRTGLIMSLVTVLLVQQVVPLWPDMRAQHQDTSTRIAAERLLRQAPPDALLLSNWHYATSLWYLQLVEGQRPDVEVVYVYPEGDQSNAETWMRRITSAVANRSVIVTNWFYEYDASGLVFEPLADAWIVRLRPSAVPPDMATRVAATLGERIRIEAVHAPETGVPGETLLVDLYWRPIVRLDRDYSVFIQLLGPEGVVGQADRAQPTSSYAPGQMRSDSYALPLLLQTRPGTYELIAGFYTQTPTGWERLTTGPGQDYVTLGRVTVHPGSHAAATLFPRYTVFDGGCILNGMDIDRSVPGWTRLYLHWSRNDITLGVPLRVVAQDAEGQPLGSAMVPALRNGQTATVVIDLEGGPAQVELALQDAAGNALRPLTVFRLPGATTLTIRIPGGDRRYVPLGGTMVYVDQGWQQSTVEGGQPLRARPVMLSLRRLTRDITLSVGVSSSDGAWQSKADGTPGMGAIPTLKWLTGWKVQSLYMPLIPDAATAGPARVRLEAYDAFTLTQLAVLDERLVREGQGTFIVIDTVEVLER